MAAHEATMVSAISSRRLDIGSSEQDSMPRVAGPDVLEPRAFQCEMLEESVRRNVIVALVWFLAPNVALAAQQEKVISAQIPSVQTRLLLGSDNTETWSEQWIWDDMLKGISVVVSTHQILLDALIHGFIQMSELSLMVFDEAHHCVAKHPASRILKEFFHPCFAEDPSKAPAILGLTASPVVNSNVARLGELEHNLQAISRTPKKNREELLRYVHRPRLVKIAFSTQGSSEVAIDLDRFRNDLDIEQDPYVRHLKAEDPDLRDIRKLSEAYLKRKTYCQEQLKNLYNKAKIIEQDLGTWAVHWYLTACFEKFQASCDNVSAGFASLDLDEKLYLRQCLDIFMARTFQDPPNPYASVFLSNKVVRLIDFLEEEQKPGLAGLVFVKTRAEVAVLSKLLSNHPRTAGSYTVSTFVGASNAASHRQWISDLVDVRDQIDTLDDLRAGRRNLVVTTSALEEGIDVTACNVVVCFDKPANLKSLIQRRGRARQSKSTFAAMLAEDEDPSLIASWEHLEKNMRELYEDDMRRLQELEKSEEAEAGHRELVVERTGARIVLQDAVSHLHHFCATISTRQFGGLAPLFDIQEQAGNFTASVSLPISVDASVREAHGLSAWKTEKNAKRDAAFEAYAQLYRAGLLSDNLLPLRGYDEDVQEAKAPVGSIASLVQVSGQFNPWHTVARQWDSDETMSQLHAFDIELRYKSETTATMRMLIPCNLPAIPPVNLYWDASNTFTATVQQSIAVQFGSSHVESAIACTSLLLSSVFASRMDAKKTDFVALFTPSTTHDGHKWNERFNGTIKGDHLQHLDMSSVSPSKFGIVRENGARYILKGIQDGSSQIDEVSSEYDSAGNERPYILLQVSRFPKRSDFLHPVSIQNQQSARRTFQALLQAKDCEIDRLPLAYARFAAFVPSILHRMGLRLTAAHLCASLLAPVHFEDLELVVTAITTSAAQEPTNYQRQEFLGDSVLKFLTSLTLVSEHLRWHEGILSHAKDHIVSNASLAKAALSTGLDRFIQTRTFTGSKWRPLYVSELLECPAGEPRELSTKTLADVVEALIGAAFLSEGFDEAMNVLKIFLPSVPWASVRDRNETLFSAAEQIPIRYPSHYTQLEDLIGYSFTLESLPLEALTDSSFVGSNVSTSYERLEFLGDVCLDIIVSATSFNHSPPVPTHGLHLIRTAVVNAHFLAFVCLTLSISVPRNNVVTGSKPSEISLTETFVQQHIWSFLRHASPAIRRAQQDCIKRYEELKTPILEALEHGTRIPWALLARLEAPKFFCDIIESVIGAIYIDSHGSLAACEAFLEKLGVMGYLRRLLDGGVALYHPKEELGKLANTEKVTYEISMEDGGDGAGEKRLGCRILIGEREVLRVGDGSSQMEVETRAAEEAVQLIKSEKMEGVGVFDR
ncbi:MAG: hypothetical protein Q9174_000163 [Haloplaca sp. 1 TL-2023]